MELAEELQRLLADLAAVVVFEKGSTSVRTAKSSVHDTVGRTQVIETSSASIKTTPTLPASYLVP